MRPRKSDHDQLTVNAFKRHKVLTIVTLSALLYLSVATIRRRLKEWGALSSYNHSGGYYTLPTIPQFNKYGLWEHQGAFFSKHGTLINTVIHLVQISRQGLSTSELEQILGVNPGSYLPQYKHIEGVIREKHKRQVVYFSADEKTNRRQKQNRFPPEPTVLKLPPDAISIVILVTLVKNPASIPVDLAQLLQREGYSVDAQMIENLFTYHGLKKN